METNVLTAEEEKSVNEDYGEIVKNLKVKQKEEGENGHIFYLLGSIARGECVDYDVDLLCVVPNQKNLNESFCNEIVEQFKVDTYLEHQGIVLYGHLEKIISSFREKHGGKFLDIILDSRPLHGPNLLLEEIVKDEKIAEKVFSQTVRTRFTTEVDDEIRNLQKELNQYDDPKSKKHIYSLIRKSFELEFYRIATLIPRDLFFFLYCSKRNEDHQYPYIHSTTERLDALKKNLPQDNWDVNEEWNFLLTALEELFVFSFHAIKENSVPNDYVIFQNRTKLAYVLGLICKIDAKICYEVG